MHSPLEKYLNEYLYYSFNSLREETNAYFAEHDYAFMLMDARAGFEQKGSHVHYRFTTLSDKGLFEELLPEARHLLTTTILANGSSIEDHPDPNAVAAVEVSQLVVLLLGQQGYWNIKCIQLDPVRIMVDVVVPGRLLPPTVSHYQVCADYYPLDGDSLAA